MDISIVFLPLRVNKYIKDKNSNVKINEKSNMVVYTSYDLETSKKLLTLFKINRCVIKKLPKKLKNQDEIIIFINSINKKKTKKKIRKKNKKKVLVLTNFNKYVKYKQSGGDTSSCTKSLEYLIDNYNNNKKKSSLQYYLNFNKILKNCDELKDKLTSGFIVVDDCDCVIDGCSFNKNQLTYN